MATPLTNRLWENRNSTNSIISRLAHNELTPAWMSKDKEPLNWIRKGKNKSVSRATTLATPKCRDDFCLKSEPTTVKRSALLYEITERTNQLAKPKLHPNDFRDADKLQIAKIRTYKANDRIIDLAKPKALYAVPTKPIGQVAPSALRAVATKRIIELSKPRKKQVKKSLKPRRIVLAPCSARVTYLARPKHAVNFRGEVAKRFLKRRNLAIQSKARFCIKSPWKKLGLTSRISGGTNKKRKKNKMNKQTGIAKNSNSTRTIVSIQDNTSFKKKQRKTYRS